MSAELLMKLRQLAERRQAHISDLHHSGRWKRYYSESEFAALRQDAEHATNNWKQLTQAD
jgi:uncharacterized repeat protein (TIGR03809 family)